MVNHVIHMLCIYRNSYPITTHSQLETTLRELLRRTLWEKEKILVTNIFPPFTIRFSISPEKNSIISFVISKCSQFGSCKICRLVKSEMQSVVNATKQTTTFFSFDLKLIFGFMSLRYW